MSPDTRQLPECLTAPLLPAKERPACLEFGNINLWLLRGQLEWSTTFTYEEDHEDRPTVLTEREPGEDAEWKRWVTGKTDKGVVLRPKMPDRGVVVRPKAPVSLLPGQVTDFFIGVPLWLELFSPNVDATLTEIPSVLLSNTWFGEPTKGEICYAMRTRAHLVAEELIPRLHRAICPVQVRNSSKDILTFERICLRCPHLSIFFLAGRFWANATRMTHRGRNEWNRVVYSPLPPAELGEAKLMTGPREAVNRGFLGRSLHWGLG